jgi:hypothetical protein
MENYHYQKFGLSSFGWSSKLYVFGNLDKKLCSIYHKTLVVDKRYAYKSCGKIIIEKGVEIRMSNG